MMKSKQVFNDNALAIGGYKMSITIGLAIVSLSLMLICAITSLYLIFVQIDAYDPYVKKKMKKVEQINIIMLILAVALIPIIIILNSMQ